MGPPDREVRFDSLVSYTGLGADPYFIAHQLWYARAMYDWTVAAAEHYARSYRGFKVGAMVLAYDLASGRFGIFFGSNQYPVENGPVNEHAEQIAIKKALLRGYSLIAAVVVFGPVQADTQSGQLSETLHPCGLCRAYMASVVAICPDKARIYTFASENVTEDFSLRELMSRHGEVCSAPTRALPVVAPTFEAMVWRRDTQSGEMRTVAVPSDHCRCPIFDLGDWCPVHQSRLNPFL